jgi:hypothetical protein
LDDYHRVNQIKHASITAATTPLQSSSPLLVKESKYEHVDTIHDVTILPSSYSIGLRRLVVSMITFPEQRSTLENARNQLRLLCRQSKDCVCGHLLQSHTPTPATTTPKCLAPSSMKVMGKLKRGEWM